MAKAKAKKAKVEQGSISVSTEDIFPIIKRSLYADQDIFLRELVSNAVDASQKLSILSNRGEYEGEIDELAVKVKLDLEAGTLTVSDNGIGMTGDEVKKYINQVAFSGAEEFLKKYKDNEDIIGKFGLGFYSAFMVSSEVEILSRSYQDGAEAIRWTCDGTTSYTLEPGEKEGRGTDIILHLDDEAKELYNTEASIRTILSKYGRFLPIPVFLGEEQINDTNPLWRKAPADLKDEDYLEFFRKLYPMAEEPLFWIHLNVDSPFQLRGILYFPKIKKNIEPRRNQIQLYARQVFITDEVTDIVPDFLMLLQGVIDSPDIPLNVSRSYLQGDPQVKRISGYITKKVADKLKEIYRDDADKFKEKWDDISVFVKYGMITNEKFNDKASEFCLLTNTAGESIPLGEYKEKIAPLQTDKNDQVIYLYTSDPGKQDMYIQAANAKGYDVLLMDGVLDTPFIGMMERRMEKTRWARVDSATADKLVEKDEPAPDAHALPAEQSDRLKAAFEAAKPATPLMQFEMGNLGDESLPVVITRNEFMRRMQEEASLSGMDMGMGSMPETLQVVINQDHAKVQALAEQEAPEGEKARHLLDLALLSQGMLQGTDLTAFITRSVDL
ncbi:MAG: molecular chaperone HtpG [Bacteroidia bacterium]